MDRRQALYGVFRRLDMRAVYVAGSHVAVSSPAQPGANALTRPVRIGITGSLKDEISRKLDDASPFFAAGVLIRFWVTGLDVARDVLEYVDQQICSRSSPLRLSWRALDPTELDIVMLEEDLRVRIAQDLGIDTLTDDEMIDKLRGELARQMQRAARD